jgi:Domain of unknown function (DUF4424)
MTRLWSAMVILCMMSIIATAPAFSNDTAAELAIGGLEFIRSAKVAIESEDLKISLERITVSYRFANLSAVPVTLTVAFPLPDIDLSEAENIAFPSSDPVNFVNFETRIDGQLVKFGIEQRAFVGDNDVTSILRELKIAVLPIAAQQFHVEDLPDTARTKMVAEGLLLPFGADERGRPHYAPAWTVKTSAVREQTFPVGRPALVDHAYRPVVGSSFDTVLRKELRQNKAMAREVERYRRDYCVTDEFLRKLDTLVGGEGRKSKDRIGERRISYVLKTGANWAAPIKDFKLSIEPGGGNRLFSFCAGKLKSSSKDSTDFQAVDFLPDRDIKLLIVGRF